MISTCPAHPPAQDVRDLTGLIWQLAENSAQSQETARPPQVRFLWGKAWNIPGVVLAIAERFESFTPAGNARRSWLRMRLLRVSDASRPDLSTQAGATPPSARPCRQRRTTGSPGEPIHIYEPITLAGPGEEQPTAGLPGLVDPDVLLAQVAAGQPTGTASHSRSR